MGIRVTPEPDLSVDNCYHCFAAGRTPTNVYVAFAGISTGDNWKEEMPGPPNGTFKLPQSALHPCYWLFSGEVWIAGYNAAFGPYPSNESDIFIFAGPWPPSFSARRGGRCLTHFESNLIGPVGHAYYGGSAWVFRL